MKKFFFFPIIATSAFLLGMTTVWIFGSVTANFELIFKETRRLIANSETRPHLNGNLAMHYVGSYKIDSLTIDKFIVTNNSPDSVIYKDYGVMGVENQTDSWFRKKRTDKPQYIGKAFCGVGLEKVDFEKSLLSGESKLIEVQIYKEKSPQYEIGFSYKVNNELEYKMIWATVSKQKIDKMR